MSWRDDEHYWHDADSLLAVGDLTARWLGGEIRYRPGYLAGHPAEETMDLIPLLARLNRAGFITNGSQPGIPLVEGSGQRAYVKGYCERNY